jgi:hypothetical protein
MFHLLAFLSFKPRSYSLNIPNKASVTNRYLHTMQDFWWNHSGFQMFNLLAILSFKSRSYFLKISNKEASARNKYLHTIQVYWWNHSGFQTMFNLLAILSFKSRSYSLKIPNKASVTNKYLQCRFSIGEITQAFKLCSIY